MHAPQKISTFSTAAGDSNDLGFPYEGEDSPPWPVSRGRMTLAPPTDQADRVTVADRWPIGGTGLCKP